MESSSTDRLWSYCPAIKLSNGIIEFEARNKFFSLDNKPGLFLDFSALTNDNQILEFAKRYGPLNKGWMQEDLKTWRDAISLMSKGLPQAQMIVTQDSRLTNANETLMRLRLLIDDNIDDTRAITTAGGKIAIMPKSLLAAMWLNFAKWLNGDLILERCSFCQSWFEKTHHNRHFCDGRCKAGSYNANKDEVSRMSKEGKSPKEIAKTLGKDLGLIRKWLREADV